ncbi:25034_t:CDS:2, partial [Racocetra persica]
PFYKYIIPDFIGIDEYFEDNSNVEPDDSEESEGFDEIEDMLKRVRKK